MPISFSLVKKMFHKWKFSVNAICNTVKLLHICMKITQHEGTFLPINFASSAYMPTTEVTVDGGFKKKR